MTSVCSGCVYLFCVCRSDDNSIRITGQRETLREEPISRNGVNAAEPGLAQVRTGKTRRDNLGAWTYPRRVLGPYAARGVRRS